MSKRLYDLCCKDNIILFDNQLYKQVDGALMGGCVFTSLRKFSRRIMSHYDWITVC